MVVSRNNQKLTYWDRHKMAMQFLYAMNFLHNHKVCHRDLSYKNVLIHAYRDGGVFSVKVSDFGLAKEANSDLTSTGSAMKGSLNGPRAGFVQGFRPSQRYIRHRLHPQLYLYRRGAAFHQRFSAKLPHSEVFSERSRKTLPECKRHH